MGGDAGAVRLPRPGDTSYGAPIVVAVGAPVLALGALVVQLAARGPVLANYLLVDVTMAVAGGLLAGFLLARVPGNLVARVFALIAIAYALSAGITAWVSAADAWQWPGLAIAAWFSEWVFFLALGPQVTLALLLFPDGRAFSRRWRPLVWLSAFVVAGLAVASMAAPEVHVTADRLLPNPFGGSDRAPTLVGLLLPVLGVCALSSAVALVWRLHHSTGRERRAVAPYVGAAVLVVLVFTAVQEAPPSWEPVAQALVLPLLPLAATLGIIRYRLFDLEVLVRRSLVWALLTALVVVGYALLVQATATLLQREAGLPESLVAVGAVAVVFQPTRSWLQRLVGRWLYGHRDDPEAALTALGQELAITAAPGDALAAATDRLADALALPWVAIEVDRSDAEPHVAESGSRPAWTGDARLAEISLVHAGERQGRLLACRRTPREALSARDLRVLETLAYSVAATAAAYRLTDDLRRSRERLVLAREEERRRLRHDLHDDLAPLLAGLALHIDTTVIRATRTGRAPLAELAELRLEVQEAIGTVRRSVRQLRPPHLGELGLELALRERAQRLSRGDGPRIEVAVDGGVAGLPAAVESATLRIATEALTNAVRHADAGTVRASISRTDDAVVVEVVDDGAGVPTDRPPGLGTDSMRQRAVELGGELEITTTDPCGTRVRATLPCGGVPDADPDPVV